MLPESDITWLAEHRPDADPSSPQRTEQARAELIAHGIRRRSARRRARAAITVGVAVAAGAVVIAAESRTGSGAGHPPQLSVAVAPPAITVRSGPAGHAPVPSTPLVQLAADVRVMKAPALPGDATLVVRDTFINGHHEIDGAVYGGYDLYTDAGVYYYAPDSLAQLQQSVDSHQASIDGGNETKVLDGIAAAADDTPAQARQALLDTQPRDGRPPSIAQVRRYYSHLPQPERARILRRMLRGAKQPGALRINQDSTVYDTATQALEVGAGRPDVRAGAMEALDTLTGVKETHTRIHGIRALRVWFPNDNAPETIWLDARSGVPIQEDDPGNSKTAFIVERVYAHHLPTQVTSADQLR